MDSNRRDLLKDRRWMNYKNAGDRRKPEYTDGVNAFLDFAFANAGSGGKIRCPCVNCYLESFHDRKVVFYHLLARGILKDYNPWTQHGEDEDEDESSPCEDHVQVVCEEHLSGPCRNNVDTVSHGKKVGDIRQVGKENRDTCQGEKDNRDVSQENEEDGNTDTPAIPSSVWRYVNGFGMVKDGGVNQESGYNRDQLSVGEDDNLNGVNGGDPNEEKDDYEDQDISDGEYDNADDVNDCDSSPYQSSAGRDFVATEAGQMPAECESSEADQADNSGTRKKYVARRGRGRPRRIIFKELEENSGPVKVDLPAHLGRVVGPNARKFIIVASCLLKQALPPNVVKWKDLNPDDVAKLLEKVKERFIFPNESHVDDALLWQFKRWFRHWRSELRKNYYCKYETYEERLANCPPDIVEVQWKWLVDYWSTEKFKKLSEINSRTRSGHKSMTCLGQKSIARCTYELEMEQSQHGSDQYPAYLKLFESEKKKSDGMWVNEEAEAAYNKLLKLHEKQLDVYGFDDLTPVEAFTEALGCSSARILLGLGQSPVPSDGSSKRKRSRCSNKSIFEASVRARVQCDVEQRWAKREAQIEKKHSEREAQIRGEMREQIRLIWEELASSSTNASGNGRVTRSHERITLCMHIKRASMASIYPFMASREVVSPRILQH